MYEKQSARQGTGTGASRGGRSGARAVHFARRPSLQQVPETHLVASPVLQARMQACGTTAACLPATAGAACMLVCFLKLVEDAGETRMRPRPPLQVVGAHGRREGLKVTEAIEIVGD